MKKTVKYITITLLCYIFTIGLQIFIMGGWEEQTVQSKTGAVFFGTFLSLITIYSVLIND